MPDSTKTTEWFDVLAKVLIRCVLFGFLLTTLMFAMFILGSETIYRLHGEWFNLSKDQLNVIFYCFIGTTKLIVWLFFLIPWLAIRWVLKNKALG